MKMREETKEMGINNGMGTGVEVGMQRMRMTMQPPPPTLQSSNLHSHNHADSDYSHPPERLLSTSRLVPLPDNNVNTNGDMNNDVDSDDDKNKLKGTNSNDTTTVHTRAQTRVRRNYRDGRNAILQDGRNNIRSQGQGGQTKIQTQEEQEGKDDDDVTHLDFDLHKQVKWMMNTMESWEKTDMNIKHYQENLHVLDANVGMDPDKDIPCVDADVLRVDAMAPSSMCTTKGNANANANEIVYLQDVATGRFHRCAVTLLSENELRKENDDDDNNQNDDLNHEVRWERERKEVMNRLAYSSKKCLAFMSGTLAGAQLIIFTNDYDINNGDTMRNNNNSILMMDMSSYHSICFILTSACLAGVVMKLVRDLSKRTGMGGVGGGGDNNYGGVTGVNSNLNLDLVGCLLIGLYFTSLVLTLIVTRVEFCRQGGGGRLLDVSLSSLPLSSLKGLKLTNSISCLLAWIIVNFASVIY